MAHGRVHGPPYRGLLAITSALTRYWPFIWGQYRARGVDLRELFAENDGEDTFNIIDSIIQMDMVLAAEMDEDGLDKVRVNIMKLYADDQSSSTASDQPRGLHAGTVLEMDEEGGFGLGEAPLSM